MYQINQITSDYLQVKTLVLPDGSAINLTLYYVPMQLGWFIRTLTYGTFTLNNIRISLSPNILHQFLNQIPFGIMCSSTLDREPTLRQDFSSGNFELFVITQAEAAAYKGYLSGV